ncbi:1-deoxy-D-xylulose-5-phosphate synthase [Spiroplasma chinense]|uniref:1-deoxy-D-xylulose-5-phosphate synthase n=1 Tax=Spiroplasma chinense TaxID=216932 RepID=A0A5B9Y464_9MOLU|nr:1-deoxy-D-xylulose-5-phosphate synthase N-terminal domain-containing protein [Spiroplasma chinense]QEH61864.1 1-deoxy-D-xylulose-5-phosphate synthase [Spiroplasma chinense]
MLLKDYKGINDLKDLDNQGLEELSQDLRNAIIAENEANGGHLGSNLAVVELTVSLLKHFQDKAKILFDTSYQAYSYKRLTDRFDIFENMHKIDGYSIFQETHEGDPYSGGHTSISAAWASGYKKIDNELVIEVIGDGSLASSIGLGGMLNFASDLKNKGLFILNDNKQGIGINKFNYLNWELIAKGMDFDYIEVQDGHDFDELEKAWKFFESSSKNVFVKVNSEKAKGYKVLTPEQALHYTYPKNYTPSQDKTFISSVEVFVNQLDEILKDKNSYVYMAGMMYAFGLSEVAKKYPGQIIDAGIAEEIAMIEAAAAANLGKKVYLIIASSFFQRTYDQIVHDLIRNNSNLTIIIAGANYSLIGDSHHGIYDLNMYNAFESILIYQPSTVGEFNKALFDLNYKGTKVIRVEDLIENVENKVDLNKWTYDVNVDANKVVIAYGSSYEKLKKYIQENNLNVGLVKAVSLNPIDKDLIQQLVDDNKQIYTYELVFAKNNLASSIRVKFENTLIKDFSFRKNIIGRASDDYIMKNNNLDFDTVFKSIEE